MDEEVRTGEIIIDFSKAFSSVPHDRLRTEMAATGVDLRVVVWVKEFVLWTFGSCVGKGICVVDIR